MDTAVALSVKAIPVLALSLVLELVPGDLGASVRGAVFRCVPLPAFLWISFRHGLIAGRVMGFAGLPSLLALAGLVGLLVVRLVIGVIA